MQGETPMGERTTSHPYEMLDLPPPLESVTWRGHGGPEGGGETGGGGEGGGSKTSNTVGKPLANGPTAPAVPVIPVILATLLHSSSVM